MKLGNQKLDENAVKMLEYAEVECNRKSLCKAAGISEPSFFNRKKKPECMTLRELRVYCRLGKLTDEQILSAIR